MSYMRFETDRAYTATPAIPGARQRIVIPIGRDGETVQFAFVDGLANGTVAPISNLGREYVQLRPGDGQVYNVSAACALDASESARVIDIIRSCHDHE